MSSTSVDLADHRKAVAEALEDIGCHVQKMESWGAQPLEPKHASLSELEDCDIFVGIYAFRYGCVPTGAKKSITEMEFDHARRLRKPILCFIADSRYPWAESMYDDESGLKKASAFKGRIEGLFAASSFTTPEQLSIRVISSIYRFREKALKSTPLSDEKWYGTALLRLLDQTLTALESITSTDYNQICLGDCDGRLFVVAEAIAPHKQRYTFPAPDSLLMVSFSSGRTFNIGDVRRESRYIEAVSQTKSELVVPICSAVATFGVLNSEAEEVDHYDKSIEHRVEQLSNGLADLLETQGGHRLRNLPHEPWIRRLLAL